MNPKVTIYIPVYNGARWIKDTIESCLNQTFTDFELLLIDDASIDNSVEIINSIKDDRIRLIHSDTNQGIAKTSNIAIENAKGEYIARLDQDDKMRSYRIKTQVEYLDNHPEIVVVGGNVEVHNTDNPLAYSSMPDIYLYNYAILECAWFCPIINVTSMYRKSFVMENNIRHNPKYAAVDDYRFFADIVKAKGRLYNLPMVLTDYNVHGENTSIKLEHIRIKDEIEIKMDMFDIVFKSFSFEDFIKDNFLNSYNAFINIEDEQQKYQHLDKLFKTYARLFARLLYKF